MMRSIRPQEPEVTTTLELTIQPAQRHAHHWRIAEPNGPESLGQCRTCGETKVFRNWVEEPQPFGSDLRAA
jgi:hypothetical protein